MSPMKLSPPTVVLQQRERQLAEQFLARRRQASAHGPWDGIIRDLHHSTTPLTGARDSVGLVARADPGGNGEVLMNDGGWTQVDASRLPLGSGTDTVVSLLRDFPLVSDTTKEPASSEATQGVAVISKASQDTPVAGDGTVWRLDPSTTQWTQIPFTTGTGTAIAADELSGTVDGDATTAGSDPAAVSVMSMVEAVTFAPGAPGGARAGLSTDQPNNGQLDQPAFIFTNNYDPVMVYPRANSTLEYEPLTDQLGIAGDPCDFRCVSVEVFAGRVNFFNTLEGVGANQVRFRNRLRRTARGTCDPDPALAVGSGQTDFENFEGHGVKCKKLGNVLACYFQDGVAFVNETGQVTNPYAIQTLDERRGLLSTSGLVSISNNEHFGIFDDGWWVLDSSGRWREVGVVSINGKQLDKWKRYFFERFNPIVPHRLQLFYDEAENWVRMAVPTTDSTSTVTEVWNYDLDSDRVWRDVYPNGISAWGEITIRSSAALTWAAAVPTWSAITGSWRSYGSAVGDKRIVHGTEAGLVQYHDPDFISRDTANPVWSYQSVLSDFGNPTSIKVSDRVSLEQVDSGNLSGVSIEVEGGGGETASQSTIVLAVNPGAVVFSKTHNRVASEHLAVNMSGSGQVRIRGYVVDYFDEQVETLDF